MSRLKRLIQEIHRRSLWQVLGIYLVGAWVAFQGIQALAEGLAMPEWVPGFAVVLMIVGLPIVLATAFVQEGVGAGEAPAAAAATSEAEGPGLHLVLTWKNVALGGLALVALAGVGVAGWLLAGGKIAGSPEAIRSLAVLPLENLTGDPGQEYFADVMTEAVISEFARLGALNVISRTSVMRYKQSDKSLPEIAQELGVQGVVEGSIFRAGDRVRITLQLIDARNDLHLWAQSYDRNLSDVLALQGEVARVVAEQIRLKLTPDEQAALATHRTVDPQALDLYLSGIQHLNRQTVSDARQAVEVFEASIAADPSFARAYEGLARAQAALMLDLWNARPEEALPKMRDAASRAIELDGTLSEAHDLLAQARWYLEYEWEETEALLSRALSLEPTNARVINDLSWFLHTTGRFEEGLELAKRALAADPLNPVTQMNYGWRLFHARRFQPAIEKANQIIESAPDFARVYDLLGSAHWLLGDLDNAHYAFRRYHELTGRPAWFLDALDRGYERGGFQGATRELLSAIRQRDDGSISHAVRAMIACAAEEPDEALVELTHGLRRHDPVMVQIGTWPDFDCVRSDPRFQELLRKINWPGLKD